MIKFINSRAKGTYKFDSSGKLAKVSDAGKLSDTFSKRLDAAIASHDKISVDIAPTFKDPSTGETKSVDKDAGDGVTIGPRSGGDQSVIISDHESTRLTDTSGKPLRDTSADKLVHELVGHAIPHVVGPDTGNEVDDENKVRAEIPGGDQRAPEPSHSE